MSFDIRNINVKRTLNAHTQEGPSSCRNTVYMVNTNNKHSMLIHRKVQHLVEILFIW